MPRISHEGTRDSESPMQKEERFVRAEKASRKDGTRTECVGPSLDPKSQEPKDEREALGSDGQGRRKRRRIKTRRRRRPRNDLANAVAPKVVEGVVCLMTSRIYNILGSIATEKNAYKPYTIAVDTCSGYNLVRKADLPPDWTQHVIRDAPLPRLAGANSKPLRLTAVVRLAVRIRNTTFRVPFVVADQLAVPVLLRTAFIDAHVRSIDIEAQRLEIRHGGVVSIVNAKGETSPPTRRHGRETSRGEVREESQHPIRTARRVNVPAMSQARVRVTTAGRGLVFLEPKPSLQHRHGVRLTNGVAEVLPNQVFEVMVANVSRQVRRLPKHTVVGYAKRNPLAILTRERQVAEGIAHALHISPLDVQEGEVGAGRLKSSGETNAYKGADEEPPRGTIYAKNNGRVQDEEPWSNANDWEKEIDLSHVEDEGFRIQVLEMLRGHSSLWGGSLGMIRATEHRIPLEPGTKPIRAMPDRKGPAMREMVAKEVKKMLNAGVIEPANTEWTFPVVLVPKKDGSLRFCVDYRRWNAKTLADSYPLRRMDDCVDSLGDAAVFTTLDCNSSYWQIPVAPEDRDKTTFTTHMGTFRHLRMPIGLRGAPATFQRALDIILSRVRWQICLVYLDDVIVFSRTHAEHAKHLDAVLGL